MPMMAKLNSIETRNGMTDDPALARIADDEKPMLAEVEAVIARHAGRRMHFALVLYEHGFAADCRFHFVSNTPIDLVEPRLVEMIADWRRRGRAVKAEQQH